MKNKITRWLPIAATIVIVLLMLSVLAAFMLQENGKTLLSVIWLGFIQYQIFCITHQCVHGTFTGNLKADKMIASCLLGFTFETFQTYRKVHMKHHRMLKNPHDPGEILYREMGLRPEWGGFRLMIVQPIFLIICLWQVRQVAKVIVGSKRFSRILLLHWVLVLGCCFFFTGSIKIAILWVCAYATSQFFFFYYSEVTDHFGVEGTRNGIGFSFFWLMRGPFGLWDGYHDVHHEDAAVSWLELPFKARKLLREGRLKKPTRIKDFFR